jgi:hypothetical protein
MTRRDTAQDFENALASPAWQRGLFKINMKARDDSALGGFWGGDARLGSLQRGPGVTNLEPEGFVYPDPVAVCLDLIASRNPRR